MWSSTKKAIKMICREKYLNELIKAKNNGFPKVITGIRRCGKSYLLNYIYREHLLSSGVKSENIIFLDLTKVSNAYYRDPIYLYEHIVGITQKSTEINYVIIDEIQEVYSIVNPALTKGEHVKAKSKDENIISFVDVILDLASLDNIDLYVTGSNSKMLSTDIVTEFRDKATNIRLQPLSYEEYYNYKKIDETKALTEYMIYGGMPLAVLKDGIEKENYLKDLFETTYIKDIIDRNNFRKVEALDEICTMLSTCVGDLINSEKLASLYKQKTNHKIDSDTVNSYINSFINSFILSEAFRYDLKGKKIITSTKKYYYIDTGLRNARLNFVYHDSGKTLENVIYNELIYNNYKVSVGTFDTFENDMNGKTTRKSLEVDFLAVRGNRMYYIQVCDNYSDEKTKKREIKPYISLNDQIQKIIVINSPISEMRDENGFTIIGASDFMLRFIK